MVTTEHPTSAVLEQGKALDHSRLVRAAARVRSISPQFGWPALLAFLLGPIETTPAYFEQRIAIILVAAFLIAGALALRLATRGYHRKSGFVINGPYRYIRNPVEVGAVWGMFGAGLILNLPLWYLLVVLAVSIGFLSFASLAYEKLLLEKLQENYFRYTRRVKRWIPAFLPGVNRVNRDYSLLAALREERDSGLWFLAWILVYAIRSHFLSNRQWW